MKIYGPYKRKDGRSHVVIVGLDGTRVAKSYPRLLMERKLGRELTEDETVDHIDNDFTNNSLENLQLLSRAENARKAMVDNNRIAEYVDFICPQCGEPSKKLSRFIRRNKKKGGAGPFCSRRCAGKATYKRNNEKTLSLL